MYNARHAKDRGHCIEVQVRYTLLHKLCLLGWGVLEGGKEEVTDEGGRGAWVGVGVVGTGWEEG